MDRETPTESSVYHYYGVWYITPCIWSLKQIQILAQSLAVQSWAADFTPLSWVNFWQTLEQNLAQNGQSGPQIC